MIALSPARKSDLFLIKQIAIESWNDAYASILSPEQLVYMLEKIYAIPSLEEQMEVLQQKFFLLKLEDIILGFAAYSSLNDDSKSFKLNKFYLLPGYKGKGYGKTSMNLLIEQIKSSGGKKIVLNVNRSNPAVRFYEHCGYLITAIEDISIGDYWMNDYVMERSIY